ncbi:MAG TPA: AAA family ATPase [Candidatus Bathyarchaeia archaeon]|nr:AAA family ATPase [Candidatus Bathyarchaeia archaeon]
MKLIFVYGPPASGKLTVAKELAKLTGFKLYHNHISISFVTSLFEFGTKTFHRLLDKYRKEMLEEAARECTDTIFTFVYGKGTDDKFIRDIVQRVRRHHGKVLFVQLLCNREELARRVGRPDRKAMGKLIEKKVLDDLYRVHDLDSEVPFQPNFRIDTSRQSPRMVARMIAQHYRLRLSEKDTER